MKQLVRLGTCIGHNRLTNCWRTGRFHVHFHDRKRARIHERVTPKLNGGVFKSLTYSQTLVVGLIDKMAHMSMDMAATTSFGNFCHRWPPHPPLWKVGSSSRRRQYQIVDLDAFVTFSCEKILVDLTDANAGPRSRYTVDLVAWVGNRAIADTNNRMRLVEWEYIRIYSYIFVNIPNSSIILEFYRRPCAVTTTSLLRTALGMAFV